MWLVGPPTERSERKQLVVKKIGTRCSAKPTSALRVADPKNHLNPCFWDDMTFHPLKSPDFSCEPEGEYPTFESTK